MADKDELIRPWPYAHVLGAYAKGVATIKSGRPLKEAVAQYDALQRYAADATADARFSGLTFIANATLLAVIEDRRGNSPLPLLKAAAAKQASFAYDEPPEWHWGLQECVGIAALHAGDTKAAVEAFQKNLKAFPENAFALQGLISAGVKGQNLEKRLAAAWENADDGIALTPCPAFA